MKRVSFKRLKDSVALLNYLDESVNAKIIQRPMFNRKHPYNLYDLTINGTEYDDLTPAEANKLLDDKYNELWGKRSEKQKTDTINH